jgi:outer membrane protein
MKRTAFLFAFIASLILTSPKTNAQSKLGFISFNELLQSMPEVKRADTTIAEYRAALQQQYNDYQTEYTNLLVAVNGADSAKLTKAQRDIKRERINELYQKLQGYDQQAGQELNQKRNELLQPIQKKAEDAIQQVSKENGYAYVFEKDNLHVFPPADDILPLVKKKLGIH